jgi:hypothetical protein
VRFKRSGRRLVSRKLRRDPVRKIVKQFRREFLEAMNREYGDN